MVDAIWGKVKQELRERVAPRHFDAWIAPSRATRWHEGVLTVEVASAFAREWWRRNLVDGLDRTVSVVTGTNASVALLVNRALEQPRGVPAVSARERLRATPREPQMAMPRYTFDGFVVGQSNAMAYRAACTVAAEPGARFNPLFIHGHVGLGKTHLLAATANALQEAGRRVRYISGEDFVNEMISALRRDRMEVFRRRFRGIEILILDDVHFLADKERSQAEFTHTFKALHQNGKQIVLASDRSPEEIGLETGLRNRLAAGLTVDVRAPDPQLRHDLVERKLAANAVQASTPVVEMLSEHWWENVRELEGIITRVVAFAVVTEREITPALVEEALDFRARRPPRGVTMRMIKALVCEAFGVTPEEMDSSGRTARVATSRQVAMYLCRHHTDATLVGIGEAFARDHTTVAHALSAIERRLREDVRLRDTVRTLKEKIAASR